MHSADHLAAAIIVSRGTPFLKAAEVEAAPVLCGLKCTVSKPDFIVTVLTHLEIVLWETGWCGLL